MDVLLVNPNRMKPAVAPIGLDYLADALVARGHRVELLDLCFESDPLAAVEGRLRGSRAGLVAVSLRNTDDCYFASQECFLPWYRRLVAALRAATDAPVVLGGVGYSVMPEPVLRRVGADLGIAGDGEWVLAELASRWDAHGPWQELSGLVYRRDGVVVRNPPRPASLDELPPRRRATVDNARYFREGGQGGVETKRGCPQNCIYCADPLAKGRAHRLRPPRLVADEMETLLGQGVDCLHLCDAEFNLPRVHAEEVCRELIRRDLGRRLRWYAYLSPQPFDGVLAGLMRRAGCVGINFGADSGDDALLARLGRPHRAGDLRTTAKACRDQGLVFMFDLLIGGPGETPESLRRTISLMKQIDPDQVGASVGVRIYPGTALARAVLAEGFSRSNPHLRGAIDGNESMADPVYYLSDALGPSPVATVRELVAGDERFFVGGAPGEVEANYNYNDNSLLVEAIRQGHRGAYWDILRSLGS